MQQSTGQITRRRRRRRRKGPMGRVLISSDFALLWLKQSITALCDALFATTLMIWLSTETNSTVSVGLALAALGAPYALFGPFADAAAERWSRRKTMFVTDVVRGILTVLLTLVALLLRLHQLDLARSLTITYLLCFCIGVMARFSQAAQRSALNVVVPPKEHARGISRIQGSVTIMTISGPVLSALLFLLPGQNIIPDLLLTSFLLLLSAGGAQAMDRQFTQKIRAIQTRQRQRALQSTGEVFPGEGEDDEDQADAWDEAGPWTRNVFRAGFEHGLGAVRLVFQQRPFGIIAATMALVALLGGILNTLEVFFVSAYLGRSFAYIGLILSANAAGVLLGSVWFRQLDAHLRPVLVFSYGLLGLAATTAAFISTRVFGAAVLWAAAMGVMNGLVLLAAQTTLVETGDRQQLSRLFAGYDMVTALLAVGGVLLGSYLARGITVGKILGASSALLLLASILAWFLLTRKASATRLATQKRAALEEPDEADEAGGPDEAEAPYPTDEEAETGADGYQEPDQPAFATPRRPSQQFGRFWAEQPPQPEQESRAGEDEPGGNGNGSAEDSSWETPAPAPETPLPRGHTRPRAAPWESQSPGRSLGLRARFGGQNQEE